MLARYELKSLQESERAVREILQEIALVGLWRGRFFDQAAFYGGTALRILFGLDRFSEDLDFTLLEPHREFKWAPFEEHIVQEIRSYGFEVHFQHKEKRHESAIRSAFLKTNTLEALLKVSGSPADGARLHPTALIRIKIEVDTDPLAGFEVDQHYLRQPIAVPIPAVALPDLFAAKLHAAMYRTWQKRVKGRDWYDVIWFARRKTPLRLSYLQAWMRKSGALAESEQLSPEMARTKAKERLQEIDLQAAMDDVRPFVKDPAAVETWTVESLAYWIDQIAWV